MSSSHDTGLRRASYSGRMELSLDGPPRPAGKRNSTVIGLKTFSVRSLRMFALASAAAVMLGLSGALPASAVAMALRPGCKQVCYWEPTVGKVCQWVCDV